MPTCGPPWTSRWETAVPLPPAPTVGVGVACGWPPWLAGACEPVADDPWPQAATAANRTHSIRMARRIVTVPRFRGRASLALRQLRGRDHIRAQSVGQSESRLAGSSVSPDRAVGRQDTGPRRCPTIPTTVDGLGTERRPYSRKVSTDAAARCEGC